MVRFLKPTKYDSDEVIWRGAHDGVFITRSGFKALRGNMPVLSWCKWVWKPFVPLSRVVLYWIISSLMVCV